MYFRTGGNYVYDIYFEGREKRIVIVLTTRSSPPAEADEDFFNSPKREGTYSPSLPSFHSHPSSPSI